MNILGGGTANRAEHGRWIERHLRYLRGILARVVWIHGPILLRVSGEELENQMIRARLQNCITPELRWEEAGISTVHTFPKPG